MRVENSAKNLKVAWIMQMVHVFGQFISRTVIIMVLSVEYVGLSGLFSNVLSMLSLAELGIGEAIVYSLYKPIAKGDKKDINAIMAFFQKVYIFIGCFIMIVGISLTPFIEHLIKGTPDIPHLHLIFILYVINSSVSYFFSYKSAFIKANQKNYIVTLNYEAFNIASIIIRAILLILTKDYIMYMVLGIIILLLRNISITVIANKRYPYLKEKNRGKLPKEIFAEIKKNTAAMILHKIGSIVVFATDNLILSKFLGLVSVGLYSNYYTLTSALNAFMNKFFTSISASVGNLAACESVEKQEQVLFRVMFINFWMYSFGCCGLFALLNPFIGGIWLGEEYVFGMVVVLLIVIKNYLMGMRKAAQTFKNSKGLYWQNKYMPLYESVINLVASIVFVKSFGVAGILMGTILSSLVTFVWVEPYVLYKYGFGKSSKEYAIKYLKYAGVFLIDLIISWCTCEVIGLLFVNAGALRSWVTIGEFVVQLIGVVFVSNGFLWLVYHKSEEYKYLLSIVKKVILKRK